MFALRGGKHKCDNLLKPPISVKRCVTTQYNHHWCQQCAHCLIRDTINSLVTDCHFSAEKSNCDYCTSTRHQCVLICAPEFHMSFADYLQVPPNCDQSLAAVLTQARLLHTGGASAPTKNFMRALAQVLSCQMTASVRSSDSARASLSSAAGANSVTGADI